MTQMEAAARGEITPEMKAVAEAEGVAAEAVLRGIAQGRIVIPGNMRRRGAKPLGIGEGLRVKVNANIGTSGDIEDLDGELLKARAAIEYGADTLMDLSTGKAIDKMRRELLKLPVPLGTVPIYQAAMAAKRPMDLSEDDLFRTIEAHARDGVDFMTVHAGLTRESLDRLLKQGRLTGIVSRGGSILASWMLHHGAENPLYKGFGHLLDVAREYDVTLSLGDALRPGSIKDATDRGQLQELIILGELVEEARRAGVQCMVEGPGHVPLNEVEANVLLEKRLCKGAPFYVLGPLVTDIAPGYDHITGAIGGALAALAGADFLCYVTPAEHLALPDLEDVRQGVVASRIAAHAADITRGIGIERDHAMAKARVDLDWERQFKLCLDEKKAREYREKRRPQDPDVCTMCGELCAMKMVKGYLQAADKTSRDE
ncbi:MAG: phosphomethylpyrimidine synthase ThiC [Candidatus Hydrothermarchaeota archaeon]